MWGPFFISGKCGFSKKTHDAMFDSNFQLLRTLVVSPRDIILLKFDTFIFYDSTSSDSKDGKLCDDIGRVPEHHRQARTHSGRLHSKLVWSLQVSTTYTYHSGVQFPALRWCLNSNLLLFLLATPPSARNIAPVYEGFAVKYPEVVFVKVDVDAAAEIAQQQRVSAMPTFKFFSKGTLLEEMQGANAQGLEALIIKHSAAVGPAGGASFGGQGYTMASGGDGAALDPTAARLARFGGTERSFGPSAVVPPQAPAGLGGLAAADDDDEELARAIALSMQADGAGDVKVPPARQAGPNPNNPPPLTAVSLPKSTATQKAEQKAEEAAQKKEKEDDPHQLIPLPVDEAHLAELIEMGFSDIRARKGLHFGATGVDSAVTWIAEHENDANIDDEFLVRKSDVNKVPLTPEEIEAKTQELKKIALARRQAREKEEAKAALVREKERRERGQNIEKTAEERAKLAKQREAEKLKKEKLEAKNEKARIMAEIAHDKALRAKNNGKLPSVLGVDGYNPSAIQFDQDAKTAPASDSGAQDAKGAAGAAPAPVKATPVAVPKPKAAAASGPEAVITNPAETIDSAISTLSRYRIRGDGGNALKLLQLFVKNVVANPTDVKYRSINMESNAFKTKCASLVGPVTLLRALGFEKNDDGKMILNVPDSDSTTFVPLFISTLGKLEQASEMFAKQNP